MTDPLSLSVREAARRIATGALSSESLVQACLDRIAAREPAVQAWQYLDPDTALAEARRRDASPPSGPLHGIPIAVKDVIDTADMPTRYGSPIYDSYRPAADAACVALARDAGAVVLGKTVTTEFATFTPGKTTNPHNPAHTPGGSSSGSAAAVGDGMVPLAFGTQTAGSVIRPAAYCGCVGYKPSYGLISRVGVKMLSESLDTIGIMARLVEDAAFFAGVLSNRLSLRDIAFPDAAPRFGFCRTAMWELVEPDTETTMNGAQRSLIAAGATIAEIATPAAHAALTDAQEIVMGREMAANLAWERLRHGEKLSPGLAKALNTGAAIGAERYDSTIAVVAAARAGLDAFFGDCDAVLVPAAPGEAPAGLGATGNPAFNRMWTLLGTPCVTVPVAAPGRNGLPVGVQLVGRIGDDARLMRSALFLERALGMAP